MVRASRKRNTSGSNISSRRQGVIIAVSAVTAVLTAGLAARADISGFDGFAPFNSTGLVGGNTIGYSDPGSTGSLTTFTTTDNQGNEAVSGFDSTAQNITSFDASYLYTANGAADGGAFVIQNIGTTALGGGGGSGGYQGIGAASAGLDFEFYNGSKVGFSTAGGGINGVGGAAPAYFNTGNVPIGNGDPVQVNVEYFNNTITANMVDLTTGQAYAHIFGGQNIPSVLGSSTGLIGFTGATGGGAATQTISAFNFVSGTRYTPIAVGGFNQQAIISVAGGPASVTATMDNGTGKAGDTWYEQGWNTFNTSTGLPASGSLFTSQADTSHSFQMQSYSGNDVLLLNNTSSGTLTLSGTQTYSALSFLTASGNGPSSFKAVINYANGAPSSAAISVISPDWFNGSPSAWLANGRDTLASLPTAQPDNYASGEPNLYEEDVLVPDTSDPITSINLSYSAGGNIMIFALSGQAVVGGPMLTYNGDTPTPGIWDTSTANFKNGASPTVVFVTGDEVTFDDTAVDTVHNITVEANPAIDQNGMIVNTANAYNFSGAAITGQGGLTLTGSGTVTLNNSNTFSGDTKVNSGTLVIGATGELASGNVDVSAGAVLTVNDGGALTSPALSLTDNGTVNYNGSSLSIGTLIGNGTINLNNSGPVATIGSGAFFGTIAGNGVSVTLAGSGGTLAGTYNDGTSPNALVVNSTGTWVLSGNDNYSGGTTLTAGVAQVSTASAFGSGPIIANGGAVSSTVPITLGNLVTGGALTVAANSSIIDLSNSSNTFAGPVSVLGGMLVIDTQGALGTATSINVSGGGSFEYNGADNGVGDTVTISGPGMTSNLGAPLVNGPTGALRGADGSTSTWAGGVVLNGAATIAPGADGTFTLTGPISGTGPVTFTGSPGDNNGSTIILAPAAGVTNTYTGETVFQPTLPEVLTQTTLKLGADNGISPNSGLNMVAGSTLPYATFDLAGYNQSVTYLTGAIPPASSAFTISNSGGSLSTLTISSGIRNGAPATMGVPITGNIAVEMNDPTGTGNQILYGSNTYTGGTAITKGTLTAASSNALSTGTITLRGGTLGLYAAGGLTSSSINAFTSNQALGPGGNTLPSATGGVLTMTTNVGGLANSAFYPLKVPVSDTTGFTASFVYNANGDADGIGFVLQNDPRGPSAVSAGGGNELAYSGGSPIVNSAAVLFEIYPFNNNYGTEFDSGGTVPGDVGNPITNYILTAPVDIGVISNGAGGFNGYTQNVTVTLNYNGPAQTLTETLFGQTEGTTFTHIYTGVDYSALVGGPAGGDTTAYVGFTGSTGGATAVQQISDFSYTPGATGAPQSLTNSIVAEAGTTSAIQIGVQPGALSTLGSVGPITINTGATVDVTIPAGVTGVRGVLTTPTLSIATSSPGVFTGTLDLGGNDLDLPAGSSTLADVTAMIASGFHGGQWNGTGIASAAAAADPSHLTALGVLVNDNGSGQKLYGDGGTMASTFDGSDPGLDDVLVKYTYYGDANLDGAVDGSDYTLIDNGFNSAGALTGWQNGDFNYDGKIDGSDYTLIDNAFNTQGASLGSNPAAIIAGGASSVPEPATLGLLGVGVSLMLGKRRRRQ